MVEELDAGAVRRRSPSPHTQSRKRLDGRAGSSECSNQKPYRPADPTPSFGPFHDASRCCSAIFPVAFGLVESTPTIDQVLAKNPRQQVLLLAVMAMISDIAVQAIYLLGPSRMLVDWRVVAAIVLLGAATGIVGLYLGACFLKWSATPLGGRASMATIRAVLAWGGMPLAIAAPICLEPISKSLEQDSEASELDEGEEVLMIILPADENASLPLNPGEEALYQPSPRISAEPASILCRRLAAV